MKLLTYIHRDPDARVEPEPSGPGVGWEHVGYIDVRHEQDLVKQVQACLGLNARRGSRTDFYLSGDPKAGWVATFDQLGDTPFALAIDPHGDGRYIQTTEPARVTTINRRPPEAHPGLLVRPVQVPIRLTSSAGTLFHRMSQSV